MYDFQPEDPENIWVAAAALSGRKVAGVQLNPTPISFSSTACIILYTFTDSLKPSFLIEHSGVILQRKLPYLPKRKCWFVGYAKGNAADTIHKFNDNWETDLILGYHDCRHYSQGILV